jgi:transcriptional repressor NrdR
MLCPYCKYENTKVLESRTSAEKSSIRRRRECENCEKRFTTYERVEIMPVTVIKKNGSREDYSRKKVFTSIKLACHKCDFSLEQIEQIVENVENELAQTGKREINSSILAKLVLEQLKMLEHTAYLRYASIHNNFKNVEDFINEANILLAESSIAIK